MYELLLITAIWFHSVQGLIEIGCFMDSGKELILDKNQPVSLNQRALSGSNFFTYDKRMDVEDCLEHCSGEGYRYAGLQVGYECFCGDYGYDKHGAAPASDCNRTCTGNHTQICGGDWRLSVYETGVNSEYVILSNVNVSHTWQETKQLCNQKQMTLPTFNESTLLLFIGRNQAFNRTNIWQDGSCFLNASCDSERDGTFNPPNRTQRDDANYTCLSYHIDITDKTKLKLKAITCDSAPPMLHPVCQKYNYTITTTDAPSTTENLPTTPSTYTTESPTTTVQYMSTRVHVTTEPHTITAFPTTQTKSMTSRSSSQQTTSVKTTTTKDPTTTDLTTADPTTTDPTTTDPTTTDPTTKVPTTTDPPTTDPPTTDPTTADPTTTDPTTKDPTTIDPTTKDQPTTDPTTTDRITQRPTTKVPPDSSTKAIQPQTTQPSTKSWGIDNTTTSTVTDQPKVMNTTSVTVTSYSTKSITSSTNNMTTINTTSTDSNITSNVSITVSTEKTGAAAAAGAGRGTKGKSKKKVDQTTLIASIIGAVLGAISLIVIVVISIVAIRKRRKTEQRKKVNQIMARRNPLYTPHHGLNTNNYASPLYDMQDEDGTEHPPSTSFASDYAVPRNNKPIVQSENFRKSTAGASSLAGAISDGDIDFVENELYAASTH